MDKCHCNIIQDLLPLYADDVVSPQSRELVEGHLRGCETCREALAQIREEIPVPQCRDDAVLKKLRSDQRKKQIRGAVLSALWVVVILGWVALRLYTDTLYDHSAVHGPGAFTVTQNADGQTELLLTDDAYGAQLRYLYQLNGDGTTDLYVCLVGHDPVPERVGLLLNFRPFAGSMYEVRDIGPLYNFESGDQSCGIFRLDGIRLDETIVNVWYLPITEEEQKDFYYHYLITGYLNGYRVEDTGERELIWSGE